MRVTLEGIVFRRGTRTVLDVASLDFRTGAVTALLGPNGSGKSTLLRLVAGLERPASGSVGFDGRQLAGAERSQSIAFAFQQPVFVSGTVRENFDLALRLRKLPPAERSARIGETASACGIEGVLDRDANRLSGGEAQRANLARALALRAPLTLLDEPLTGLDAPGRKQLLHSLPGLLERFTTTAIVVTHDREEALRLAGDLVVLAEGRLRATGSLQAVLERPPDPVTAEILGFTVIETDSGAVAIAPGGFQREGSGVRFAMQVGGVIATGARVELNGWVNNAPVTVPWVGTAPQPGETVDVFADAADVIAFEHGESHGALPADSRSATG